MWACLPCVHTARGQLYLKMYRGTSQQGLPGTSAFPTHAGRGGCPAVVLVFIDTPVLPRQESLPCACAAGPPWKPHSRLPSQQARGSLPLRGSPVRSESRQRRHYLPRVEPGMGDAAGSGQASVSPARAPKAAEAAGGGLPLELPLAAVSPPEPQTPSPSTGFRCI